MLPLLFLFLCCTLHAQDTTQHIVPGRKNAAEQIAKPYVILISADGFRYDYADKYKAINLLRLRSGGVQAESMIPAYPSVTYPNHYTVVTGMYPSHHGIVYNQFYDRKRKESYLTGNRKTVEDGSWYGGIPLWVLAEQHGMLSASYFYVGTEAAIQGMYSTYWYRYNSKADIHQGINAVVNWLRLPEESRPHFISFYMGEVDHEGHTYGPDSKQTEEAVLYVDRVIGEMTDSVSKLGLPVNFIFLADHGMANVDTVTKINIASMIDTSKFIIRDGSTAMHLYAKNRADIKPAYDVLKQKAKGFMVYLREDIPAKWHYDKKEDRFDRIGDIFITPDYPKVLTGWNGRINPGTHGYDPSIKEMHACFYAWGPQFKTGMIIGSFENIHVYPMVCSLLGLDYTHGIDGSLEVLENILR